ncbi:hypothetical protein EMCG_00189 [[Emmonsia] crescens]|uniref:Uncharacterized protein n=1 Tax=[Emmonsia] crescens TaxID=73230 RepID=A0A0G2JB02_9EURO|nr:hypothetical protein EMCG_00189 [Emmonsia crescens UAMH 3008]
MVFLWGGKEGPQPRQGAKDPGLELACSEPLILELWDLLKTRREVLPLMLIEPPRWNNPKICLGKHALDNKSTSTNQRARLGAAVPCPPHACDTRASSWIVNWPLRACRVDLYPVFQTGPIYALSSTGGKHQNRHMAGVYSGGLGL